MLTRLSIENYRCFGQIELLPEELTLLIGRNGTGKSSVLDLLAGLRELIVLGERVDEAISGAPRSEGDTAVEIDVDLEGLLLRYRLLLADGATGWRLLSEELFELGEDGSLDSRYRSIDGEVKIDGRTLGVRMKTDTSPLSAVNLDEHHSCMAFRDWLDGVWMLRLNPQEMDADAREASDHLDSSGENFPSWLLGFHEDERAKLDSVLASVIPGLTGLVFEEVGRANVLIARFGEIDVDFDDLSDGQRALIVLHAVLVLVGDATLLLLDEPDAHVTATEILPLVSRIREATEAGRLQALIVSHHPHMLDLLASDDVVELVRGADGELRPEALHLADDDDGVSPSKFVLLRGA